MSGVGVGMYFSMSDTRNTVFKFGSNSFIFLGHVLHGNGPTLAISCKPRYSKHELPPVELIQAQQTQIVINTGSLK